MKIIKQLSNAVPKKARWVFLVSIIVMVGILVMVWRSMSGGTKPPVDVQTGAVIESSIQKIQKSRPDEVTAAPETAPMIKQLEKTEVKKVEDAKNGDGSYVGGFTFGKGADNGVTPKKDAEKTSDSNIEDIMKRREKELATNKTPQQAAKNQPVTPLLNEDEFLKSVLLETSVTKESMMKTAQAIRDNDKGFMAQNNFQRPKNADGTEAADSEGEDGGSSYYSNFLPKSDKSKSGNKKSSGTRSFEEQVADISKVQTKTLNRGLRSYGVLNIGVNTDELSPTTATVIENGELLGAEFIAEQPVRAGEKAVITFKSMALNGKDYNVRAIALDPATQRTAIADDVNRHILERYLSLGIAAFVSGYADTLQDSTTLINNEGSSTTQKSAITDAGTQMKVAVGKVGEKFSPAFEEGFKRPPTVTVDGNREIVIMLLDPIDIIKK